MYDSYCLVFNSNEANQTVNTHDVAVAIAIYYFFVIAWRSVINIIYFYAIVKILHANLSS